MAEWFITVILSAAVNHCLVDAASTWMGNQTTSSVVHAYTDTLPTCLRPYTYSNLRKPIKNRTWKANGHSNRAFLKR